MQFIFELFLKYRQNGGVSKRKRGVDRNIIDFHSYYNANSA